MSRAWARDKKGASPLQSPDMYARALYIHSFSEGNAQVGRMSNVKMVPVASDRDSRALCDGVTLRYDRLVGIGGLDDQAPHLF
jgi:hypothetical protein